jgi:hypothetical protein
MESRHSLATTHRCEAKIRADGTCLVRVEPRQSRCRFHGGQSTGPKTEQGRARIAEAHGVGGAPIGPAGPSNQLAIVGPGPDHLDLTHRRRLVRLLERQLPALVAGAEIDSSESQNVPVRGPL